MCPNAHCQRRKEKSVQSLRTELGKQILRHYSILISTSYPTVSVIEQEGLLSRYLHHCSRCCICSTISLQISSRSCISSRNFSCRSFKSSAFMASITCRSSWEGHTSQRSSEVHALKTYRPTWNTAWKMYSRQASAPKFSCILTSFPYVEMSTSFSMSSPRPGSVLAPVSKLGEARRLCSLRNECIDGNPSCVGGACTS